MKTTLKILTAFVIVILVVNCKKEDLVVCAKCIELTTHDTLTDYCGPKASVDQYVKTLETTGSAAGLNYDCTIK
jgi:hypothetical protein